MTKHEHREAFMLMTYATHAGETEVIWNSRDGVAPRGTTSRDGEEMFHVHRERDVYAPDHVPQVGDRIFVDLTEQRARVIAARLLEQMEQDPDMRSQLEADYESREAAVAGEAQRMLTEHGEPPPDVLVVTAGYIEELLEVRKRGAAPEVSLSAPSWLVPMEDMRVPQPSSFYFDKQHKPISDEEYFRLKHDETYFRIARDEFDIPRVVVSTVWLGYSPGGGNRIFETLVQGEYIDEKVMRYRTEEDARLGHGLMVEAIKIARAEHEKKGS